MTITALHPVEVPQPIQVVELFGAFEIDALEVTDAEVVSDTLEHIDIGGVGPLFGRHVRLQTNDLLAAADALHRLADRISEQILDARLERMEAERHDCFCGVRLEADEISCGSPRCDRLAAQEASL